MRWGHCGRKVAGRRAHAVSTAGGQTRVGVCRPGLWRRMRHRGFAPSIGILFGGPARSRPNGAAACCSHFCYISDSGAGSSNPSGLACLASSALIWGAGSLLGPLVGGVFAGLHAWRMAFLVFAALAAALWVLASLWLPTPSPSRVP